MVKTCLLAGVVLLTGAGLTGCTSEPKASELAAQLKQVGTEQLDEAADTEAADGVKPTMTEDASKDVSCGDGKVKRVFAGSFPFKPNPDVDSTFDLAFKSVLGAMDTERYPLTKKPESDDLNGREFVFTGKDKDKVTFTFTFTAGATPTLALRGETACLDA
jgi:outer membrane murein-binding lipoprotein Lpp